MSIGSQLKAIDVERVILVPIMSLLLLANVLFSLSGGSVQSSSRLVGVLYPVRQVLVSLFYTMIVVLLLARVPAKAKTTALAPRLAAYAGSFVPFLIPSSGASETTPILAAVGVVLMILGQSFAAYSLSVLGRNFGVEPQVRTLVQRGPYRYIRHPLYTGEFVAAIGIVAFSPSIRGVAVLIAFIALQTYRAVQEERLLETNVPEYTAYKKATKRFVPGLF